MSLSPSTSLGRYEVLSQLGAGGMGEVYLAHDTRLNRRVALKVLPADLITNRERLRRFEQEAQAASALNHPNIITIHEIGAEGDTHFIATEFIEGETLRRRLQTTQVEIEETLNIATQIAAALDAAHRSRIVHRDIKPENVMVRADGLVKVLDFGLAKLAENKDDAPADTQAATRVLVKTSPGVVMGTVAYMSPEQARGKEVDARTDIFSLGVVVYEMVTGRVPFGGETGSDVIAAILKAEPAPLDENTPAELQRIVRKTLQKSADERYQTAKDLLIDLKNLTHHLDFTAELERSGKLTKAAPPAPTQDHSIHTTSSAEDVASGIKQHKGGFTVALAVLVLTALGFGYWFYNHRSANTTQIESIAVLPFVNESGNPDVEYMSDGISESLINSLSQLPNVRVLARSTMFRFKGKESDPQAVGKQLGVETVLTGRVVQRGDSLTIQTDLVSVLDGSQLWGERYNRRLTDVLAVQEEIVRDVSHKLRGRLSGTDEQRAAKNYTANPEAYQLYLKGLFYRNKFSLKDTENSIPYFQQAIAADPSFALPFAGLADSYVTLTLFEGGAPTHEVMPKARDAALKALTLDDGLAEAHTALGFILFFYDYDFVGSEREFKRALELNPNFANAHQRYSQLLTYRGRHEESLAEMRRALEIDPLSLIANRGYGDRLLDARRYDEAVAQLRKTLELDRNFSLAYSSLALVHQAQGDHAESVEAICKAYELTGRQEYAALARESFAKRGWQGYLRTMMERRPDLRAYTRATFHAALGEKDKAFAGLNKAYENRESFLVRLKVDPRLDPLRSDPRFQDLLRRVGFMP